MGWYVYQITNDPVHLGFTALAEAVPYMICNPLSGYLADRIGRRKPVLCLVVCIFILTFHLAYIISDHFQGNRLFQIYLNFCMFGLVRGLFGSGTLSSIIALVVPREHYQRASSWNGIFVKSSLIIGPVLGGILYAAYGPVWANLFVPGIMVIIFLLMLSVEDKPVARLEEDKTGWQKLTYGFKFVLSHKVMRTVLILDFIAAVFSGVTGLLPVFAKDILHLGPEGLGYLRSSLQGGAVIAGIILGHYQIKNFAGRKFILAEIICSLFLLAFAFSTYAWLSVFFLFMAGFFDYWSTIIRQTIMRLLTPEHLLGRVTSVRALFTVTANEMSTFESGLVASAIGAVPSIIFGVTITIGAAAWTWFKEPSIRKIHMGRLLKQKIS